MKKKELLELHAHLRVCQTLSGKCENITKFLYGVERNILKQESEIKALEKASNPSQEIQQYDQERIALCKIHANKKDGQPIIINNAYDLSDASGALKEEFAKAFEELKEKYKDALDKREEQMKQFDQILEEEVEIELYKIKLDNIPDDIAKHKGLMSGIMCLIEE